MFIIIMFIFLIPTLITIILRKLPILNLISTSLFLIWGIYLCKQNTNASILDKGFMNPIFGLFLIYGSVLSYGVGIIFLIIKIYTNKKQNN